MSLGDKAFTWLHVSDLHAGMKESDWLWPQTKAQVIADISKMAKFLGPVHLLIFTGDLAQSGSNEQFSQVTGILLELLAAVGPQDEPCKVAVIPGNHDLSRPRPSDPGALLLRQWEDQPAVREDTLSGKKSVYKATLDFAFNNYTSWVSSLSGSGVSLLTGENGIFAGDFAACLQLKGGTVGVIGLNSTWMQLDGADYEGKLVVDPAQLIRVTQGDPDKWLSRNTTNILLTHHPRSWLTKSSQSHWDGEIRLPSRFALHMYGHMHEPDAISLAHGGGPLNHSLQAASLCGLERYGTGPNAVDRTHGYSFGKLTLTGGAPQIQVWPRRLELVSGGYRKFIADYRADLGEDDASYILGKQPADNLAREEPRLAIEVATEGMSRLAIAPTSPSAILEKVRSVIPSVRAAQRVRLVEQRLSQAAIQDPRAFWLVSDWGAGADGFIASLFKDAVSPAPFYRIDFSTFTERNDFLASIKPRLGFNFEQFVEALSENGHATFILDGVPSTGSGAEGALDHEIEALVQIVLQYCPEAVVILRTMSRPRGASLPIVELGPLDEADLRNYILDHSLGGEGRASPQDVSSIFRHTDGVPARVDAALKDLEVVSVSQLGHTNRDLISTPAERSEAPDALARAVSELAHSSDPVRARAFQLLKALAAFPQGERLERVHRFYGPHGVSTLHARELLDASLLTSVSVAGSAPAQEPDSAPLLLVPRPVRDHVRSTLKSHELVDLTKDAAKLYFGDKWQEGKIRPSIAQSFGRHDADNFEIVNASTILTRLLTDAIATENDRDIEAALAIGSGFMSAIAKGDHYRSVIAFARDFLSLIPDEKGATRKSIEYEYARALRMTGNASDAIVIFERLIEEGGVQSRERDINLSVALAYKRAGSDDLAISAARKVVANDKNSHAALQARSILIELQKGDDRREALFKLEKLCRKKGAHTPANNLALARAEEPDMAADQAEQLLKEVMGFAAKSDDYYNLVRATVRYSEIVVTSGRSPSDKERRATVVAYRYLFAERSKALFDRCHDALWSMFESRGEMNNLFRLFQQSSLMWRLSGDDTREARYVAKLARYAGAVIQENVHQLSREVAYFLVRRAHSGQVQPKGA